MSMLLEQKLQSVKRDLADFLRQRDLDFDSDFEAIFNKSNLIAPFTGLTDEYQRRKFYKEEMSLLVGFIYSPFYEVLIILHYYRRHVKE